MAEVRETYEAGKRLIIIHTDNENEGPKVLEEDEAKDVHEQLGEIF